MSDLRFFGSESRREAKPAVKDFAHNHCVMSVYQNGSPARLPRPQLKRQIPAQAVHAHSCCRGAYKFVNEMHERSKCSFRYARAAHDGSGSTIERTLLLGAWL
jgi:hypothetical protein